jgi:hypothetical protein
MLIGKYAVLYRMTQAKSHEIRTEIQVKKLELRSLELELSRAEREEMLELWARYE